MACESGEKSWVKPSWDLLRLPPDGWAAKPVGFSAFSCFTLAFCLSGGVEEGGREIVTFSEPFPFEIVAAEFGPQDS